MHDSITVVLGLGFALGLRHATEADHLAAVSTMVSQRHSVWESARVGGLWGMGHSASLFAAGLVVVVLGVVIPARMANFLELAVAAMIVALGSRILYLALRGQRRVHVHAHTHNGRPHVHLHFHGSTDSHPVPAAHEGAHSGFSGWRPFIVGTVHGLAGSAALTLLVLTDVMRTGTAVLGLAYLLVFGVGSIGGMLVMSCLIGLPFHLSRRFSERAPAMLRLTAGAASTVFGFVYAWNILQQM
jgi:ABC-type nickel/cobalt efflux system permease component RcnA